MDLIAALALVLVIEGIALVVFAGAIPSVLAALSALDTTTLRWGGLLTAVAGSLAYLLIRQPEALAL